MSEAGRLLVSSLPAALVYKLLEDRIPSLQPYKNVIAGKTLNAGAVETLHESPHKFALVMFSGDGDPQVRITAQIGQNTYTFTADSFALFAVINETLKITAENTDTTIRASPTIEIAGVRW